LDQIATDLPLVLHVKVIQFVPLRSCLLASGGVIHQVIANHRTAAAAAVVWLLARARETPPFPSLS
jgi:hypothetical protein